MLLLNEFLKCDNSIVQENREKQKWGTVFRKYISQSITLDVINLLQYDEVNMIKTFASKETEKLFQREVSRGLPTDIQRKARQKLEILDAAEILDDLKVPPGNRLEKLRGDREGQHSIRINQQWRICFRWKNGNCFDVGIVDYH